MHARVSRRARPLPIAVIATLLLVVWPGNVHAQRTGGTDLASVVRQLVERRTSSSDAARVLMEQYRQSAPEAIRWIATGYSERATATAAIRGLRMSPAAAARALRGARVSAPAVLRELGAARVSPEVMASAVNGAGYPAREALPALSDVTGREPFRSYRTLRDGGYAFAELSDAVVDLGVEVDLSCMAPDGSPAPCGNFGNGEVNEPAMGQVTVSPQNEGEATTEVLFESTNIPPVDVLFDGQQLEVLEMNSSRVRARLPNQARTGELAFRRQEDGVLGVLDESYAVIPYNPLNHIDWEGAADAALTGALADADRWLDGSRFRDNQCWVFANFAVAEPGILRSTTGFGGSVRAELEAAGFPSEVADGWQRAFERAFLEWADNVSVPSLPLYPAFAAWPDSVAPEIPNVPMPVGALLSSGVDALTPSNLSQRIASGVPGVGFEDRTQEINAFATDFALSFTAFLGTAQFMNVLGGGRAPAYTYPKEPFHFPVVPVSPVVAGSCTTPGRWLSRLPSGTTVQLPDLSYMLGAVGGG